MYVFMFYNDSGKVAHRRPLAIEWRLYNKSNLSSGSKQEICWTGELLILLLLFVPLILSQVHS